MWCSEGHTPAWAAGSLAGRIHATVCARNPSTRTRTHTHAHTTHTDASTNPHKCTHAHTHIHNDKTHTPACGVSQCLAGTLQSALPSQPRRPQQGAAQWECRRFRSSPGWILGERSEASVRPSTTEHRHLHQHQHRRQHHFENHRHRPAAAPSASSPVKQNTRPAPAVLQTHHRLHEGGVDLGSSGTVSFDKPHNNQSHLSVCVPRTATLLA